MSEIKFDFSTYFQACIMHAFHRGLSEQEAQDELESVYGPDLVNPAFTNIWFIKFNREGTPIWNNNRMSRQLFGPSFYPLSNHTHKHKTEVLDERNEQQSSSSGSLTPASVASAAEIPQAQSVGTTIWSSTPDNTPEPDPGNTVDATLDSTLAIPANLEPETSTTGLHSTSSFPVDLPGINGSNGHQKCGLVKLARIFPYINNSNKPENSSSSSAHTLSTSSRNSPEDASNDHSNIGLVETTVLQMKAVKTEPGVRKTARSIMSNNLQQHVKYKVKRLQCGECTEVVPYASRSGHVNKCHLGNIMLHSCMICNQESAAVSRAPMLKHVKRVHIQANPPSLHVISYENQKKLLMETTNRLFPLE